MEISEFLKKYQKIIKDEKTLQDLIKEVLKEFKKTEIEIKKIKVKDRSIFLECHPSFKSWIFINKKNIIDNIKKRTGLIFEDIF